MYCRDEDGIILREVWFGEPTWVNDIVSEVEKKDWALAGQVLQ